MPYMKITQTPAAENEK